MNISKIRIGFLSFACFFLVSRIGFSQITSTADAVVPTEYSSGAQDNIHVFCSEKGELKASLIASYPQGETGTFEWQKYNPAIGDFDPFPSDATVAGTSTISNLADGCYRVKISPASGAKTYTAWVFNNYLEVKAEIPLSDCKSFTLLGDFEPKKLIYTDLSTGQPKELNKQPKVEWSSYEGVVSHVLTTVMVDPPTKNTNYTFTVTDRFGCVGKADVQYLSIVTKASFKVVMEGLENRSDPTKIEAPLTISFTNTSENGDPGKFEWFILKKTNASKDSLVDRIYNDTPSYTFEETGTYKLKLVSKHATCTDTISEFELDGKIQKEFVIDASFIDAPNVFTPNGDLSNEKFVVKFFSMKTVKITILNRWGKVLHVWQSNNVQGFNNTASDKSEAYVPQSVWDGKVGGQMATPGVYFWVAEGIGRDGVRRKGNGFVHLFRGK